MIHILLMFNSCGILRGQCSEESSISFPWKNRYCKVDIWIKCIVMMHLLHSTYLCFVLWNAFNFDVYYSSQPFMTDSDTDEKPYVDLINSKSVPSGENSQLLSGSSSGMAEMDDIEYWTISGKKPYFDIILAKSHVGPRFQLVISLLAKISFH